MSLTKYNSKRNFNSTNEPKGNVKKSKGNKFVIQHHKARANHYDFRLEHNGVLLSWAVPKGLSQNPKDKRLAVMVEDHPLEYITFEGIIPKGNYGAGTVEIFDKGTYLPIEDIEKGIKKGHIKFVLNGNKLQGGWSLIKTNSNNWLIVKIEDEYVQIDDKKKKEKLPFSNCNVQLATLTKTIPKGKDWIYEIKYDGYRILAFVENGKVKLFSRNGTDYSNKFKNICNSLKQIDKDCFILDGEVVAFDEKGRSDFGLLQKNIKTKKDSNFYYVIFDLLAVGSEDLRELPLIERKSKLERLLYKTSENLMFSKHVENGLECFKFAKEHNLEGIVAKNKKSLYEGKRNGDWLKIKCYLRQEFVVAGFTTSSKNKVISALVLGYYHDKDFIYIGKVGTGFSEQDKKELSAKFKNYVRKTCPFTKDIKINNVTWLKPHYVAEIQFAELTKDKLLRQPSFIGLRNDKKANLVKLEISE